MKRLSQLLNRASTVAEHPGKATESLPKRQWWKAILPAFLRRNQAKQMPESADSLIVKKEKRKVYRELCADLVKVQWEPAFGPARSEWAILEDISSTGACLEFEEPIAPDTVISLHFKSEQCKARIRYCKYEKTNYLLGVEFEQGYRWSRRRFKPEHLIQFRLRQVR